MRPEAVAADHGVQADSAECLLSSAARDRSIAPCHDMRKAHEMCNLYLNTVCQQEAATAATACLHKNSGHYASSTIIVCNLCVQSNSTSYVSAACAAPGVQDLIQPPSLLCSGCGQAFFCLICAAGGGLIV